MPGAFDGFRISVSGINAQRVRMETIANNIAHAADKNYSRQDVRLENVPSILSGDQIYGMGVRIDEIIRIRDELLDQQLRVSSSSTSFANMRAEWLQRIQLAYNEPSDTGLSSSLSRFWEAWNDLATDPESAAARTEIMSRTEELSFAFNTIGTRLDNFTHEVELDLEEQLHALNSLAEEIAQLNKDIFDLEAGSENNANNLRDQRDAALDQLSEFVNIKTRESTNGMMQVYVDTHAIVNGGTAERIVARDYPLDNSKTQLMWEFGDQVKEVGDGTLAALLDVRDTILAGYVSDLDTLASDLVNSVNEIYADGVGLHPYTSIESRLGYAAFGVESEDEALGLVAAGESAAIHISLYDDNDEFVRMETVLIDADDSLEDIQLKLDDVNGVDVSLLSGVDYDGRLRIEMEPLAGEASFTVSNYTGGHDTSGFLNLVGFNATEKSGTLSSSSLQDIADELGVSLSDVFTTELNLAGSFTISAYEGVTDPTTSGYNMRQYAVQVVSSDTLTDVINKMQALTGIDASASGVLGTDTISVSTDPLVLMTDDEGNIDASGSNSMTLSFENKYHGADASDAAPANHTGTGDDTSLLSTLQFNTLFSGSSATDIALDSKIQSSSQVHAGHKLGAGENSLALDMVALQFAHRAAGMEMNFDDGFQSIVTEVGTDVSQASNIAENEQLMLEGFISEKDRISGVNLDEELANMMLFQRAYEANAKVFATIDEMIQELLRL